MASEPIIGRGRPRAFDEARALDGAIDLFSAIGFSAAAVSDLTGATGLSVGSLYKAYHDKQGLFARALERYIALRDIAVANALAGEPSGRDRVAAILRLYAALGQGEDGRRGCMIVAGVAELDVVGDAAGDLVRAGLARRRATLEELVATGQADGSIRASSEPGTIADLLLTLIQGMRVVGKGGLFPADAEALIALALKSLD